MDKLLSVHQKKAITKQTKPKKKPIKVVYISNPMKVKTSASEFRALVQELTGRDAVIPSPGEYPKIDGGDSIKICDDPHASSPQVPIDVPKSDLTFDPYDDVFMDQMVENFAGFLPSNSCLYEPPHVDVLSLDAV
ncbi:sigma factor binding protein 1, chloroplastic-like [Actinidia eriantha]|uniref:sigma factor binding protein 1, chloroplastic-like n=1 Tax=Actinidia eriantha TaxID=165200 RepID=UPI00258ADD81|nr:sigma factor binding protein 1, chloroplastic-like [Actinidia eriantha]